MATWYEYQVEERFNPTVSPAADHSWRPSGSPRPTLTEALRFLRSLYGRPSSEGIDFRLVRKGCEVIADMDIHA